ncbi:hypothetical protein GCM10022224_103910 [Nonomuraea antimicrobica]|uniref:Uncharacterized protein n=1 Tax=Nonomuraea antimicrobica TaxID=561173 RepID=A0ABP7ETA3_9ACTN
MATVYQYLPPEEAALRTAAGFPQFVINQGTTFPVTGLAFDGAGTAQEYAYWKFTPFGYAAGADVTVEIIWYAVSGTSGTVNWGAAIAAITPSADTEDVETAGFAGMPTVTTSHLGTTARRLHRSVITVTDQDGMAVGDECWLRVMRNPAVDTLTADAILTSARISYPDT